MERGGQHHGQMRDCTEDFLVDDKPGPSSSSRGRPPRQQETDAHRLAQRQKQVDFGKNTIGYERYLRAVPKHKRRRSDPQTPDITQQISKRNFDAQVRQWRRQLHDWDIKDGEAAHVFTATSAVEPSQDEPSTSAANQAHGAALGAEVVPTTAQEPFPDSKKRPLLQQVMQDSNKRQQVQQPGSPQNPRSGTSGCGDRKAPSGQADSSWGEQENMMEAAARADLFQDWEDDILL